MSGRLRVFALFALIPLVAFACSKPKEQAGQLGGKSKGASALESSDQGPAGAEKSKPRTVNAAPGTRGYAALNPAADQAQAARVGQLIKIQSESYANPNTWTGVTKDTIKLAFNIDVANCGVNIIQLISNAGGELGKPTRFKRQAPSNQETINKEHREAIDFVLRYWNDHAQEVAADIPKAVELMKKYNTAGHPFYGRKLIPDIVDAGSFQCPDKQTAAAIRMRDSTKPFSAVVYDVPGLYQNGVGLASAMKAKIPTNQRPMIFGLLDTTDKYLSSFAPYAWDEFQSITKMSKLGASWICSDLKAGGPNSKLWGNGKAVNAVDPALRSQTRKFGLVYANNANSNEAAAEFKNLIKAKCGITFDRRTTEFQINDNPARASGEAGQIATRFKLAGVTTVIYLIDFLGAFFHIIQFKQQGFKPEFANIGTGWQTNTVQRLHLDQDMVDKASMAYTSFGIQGFGYGPGDAFWVYHTYHKTSPTTKKPCDPRSDAGMDHDPGYCKMPSIMEAWYYSWLPLVGGMLFAGPNLTPNTAAAGLQAYPLTRYGVNGPTSDPVAVLVGAGPGQYYFITDGSSMRWRAGFVSPPPENLLGFPDYPDCQRHYLDWPDKLAPQWEKGGPNFNTWCGDPKYANFDYKPSVRSEQTCADAPSGKCEKDNYPRWQPIVYR